MDFEVKTFPVSIASPEGAQAIGRAMRLLRLVGAAGVAGASLSRLVEESGLSKPTCRRLLLALMADGMVEQDPMARAYFLGREAYLLGVAAAERHGIHRLALDSVARLAQATGDAAFLQVRHGDDVVCLARQDGSFPLRSHVLQPGDRHPLGVGAGPLAILAALPEAEAQDWLARHGAMLAERYPRLAPHVPGLLAEARACGFSLNRGLIFPGSWGMGMVIRDPSGRIEACLSLAAVESRMQPERQSDLAQWLRQEVQRVEERLAHASGATVLTSSSAPHLSSSAPHPSPTPRKRSA